MFRKMFRAPLVLAFAIVQSPLSAQQDQAEVARPRAEQPLWLARKAAKEAAAATVDNSLYLTERRLRELRLEKKVASVDGFNQEILSIEPVDSNVLRILPLRQGATAFEVIDEDGNSRHFAVLVAGDTRQIELILRRHFPDAKINVDAVEDAVILSGEVADSVQIEQAVEVAEQFYPRVLNWLKSPSATELLLTSQPAATEKPLPARAEPTISDAPTFNTASRSESDTDLREVISEIRSLRTLIQEVRSDVLKLKFALRQQSTNRADLQPAEAQPELFDDRLEAHRTAISEAHAGIERALDESIEIHVTETPLRDVLQQLAKSAAINVVVDARALEEEGITAEQSVTLELQGVTLRSALNLLIADLGLTWVIEDEVLKITNRLRAAGGLTVQVYRLSEVPGSEANQVERLAQIKELIMATIAPDSWREVGGSGHISVVPVLPGGRSLVIRQTETIHAQIQILLRALNPLMSTSASDAAVHGGSLETLQRGGRISVPIVELPIRKMLVIDSRIETPRKSSASGLRPIPSGRPLEVGSGREQASAVIALPTVDLKGGVYVDRSRQSVSMTTRNYAIGRKLLQRFRAADDSNADAAKKLAEYIRSSIDPDSWDADGMEIMTDKTGEIRLVISHSPGTHDRVRRLFEQLEAEVNAKQPDEEL